MQLQEIRLTATGVRIDMAGPVAGGSPWLPLSSPTTLSGACHTPPEPSPTSPYTHQEWLGGCAIDRLGSTRSG